MNGQDPFYSTIQYITHLNGGFVKWHPKPMGFNTTKAYKGLSWASHKPGWGAQRRWHLQQDDWNSCDKSRKWQRKSDQMGYRGMLKWVIHFTYIYIYIYLDIVWYNNNTCGMLEYFIIVGLISILLWNAIMYWISPNNDIIGILHYIVEC